MSIAYIALGSNLGDKEANLRQALKMLLVKGLQIRSVSSFFKTEPYGVTDQPEFINAVACVKTDLAPEKLLKLLLDTELEMGRVRLRHWGERNIDLDLLLYDDLIYYSENWYCRILICKTDFLYCSRCQKLLQIKYTLFIKKVFRTF